MVWRLAGDRVLVHSVERAVGADLVGVVGVVWVAIEAPCSSAEIAIELGIESVVAGDAIASLVAAGWAEPAEA